MRLRTIPRRLATLASVCFVVGCGASVSSSGIIRPASPAPAPSLRVMTFNLRYDTPSDGPNAWPHRRDWVAALIRFHAPDAIGVQEALAHMLGDLDARLPGFARVGVGRADGRAGGEFSAILYRRER